MTGPERLPRVIDSGRIWEGQTVTVVASGSSLTQAQVAAALALGPVIATNSSIYRVPAAAMLYACDEGWWTYHRPHLPESFTGLRVTQNVTVAQAGWAEWVKGARCTVWMRGESDIYLGSNSGHQAVGVAALLGAARVFCVGMDLALVNGQRWHHAPHPADYSTPYFPSARWRADFGRLVHCLAERGVEVVQASGGWAPMAGVTTGSIEEAAGHG